MLISLITISLNANSGEWYIDNNSESTLCYKDNSKNEILNKQELIDKYVNRLFQDDTKRGKLYEASSKIVSKGFDIFNKLGLFAKKGEDLCLDYHWAIFGRVKHLRGEATISKSDPMPNIKYSASYYDLIFTYDTITTHKNSAISINGEYLDISIGENSKVAINQEIKRNSKQTESLKVSLFEGFLTALTDSFCKVNADKCTFVTKMMALGIRGTAFKIDLRGDKERFYCIEGEIYVFPKSNPSDITYIRPGEYAEVDKSSSVVTIKQTPSNEQVNLQKELLKLKVDDDFIKEELSEVK